MNIVVVYAHPYDGSFCKGILESVVSHLEERGANVKVKDLVKMGFNATMLPEDLASTKTHEYTPEVKAEQDDLMWSDAVITIAPVWFGMCPGFLKGYWDKVLISGFGYDGKGIGLMKGKRIYSIFTCGSTNPYLSLANQFKCIEILWDNLFGMCGFSDVSTKYFLAVPHVTEEVRKDYLAQANAYVDQIFDKAVGETGQLGFGAVLAQCAGHMGQKYREYYGK